MKTAQKNSKVDPIYDASSIVELDFLEAVRRRPGMYIGNAAEHGLHHILMEIVDNSVDECMAGAAKKISITIDNDGSVSVEDDGRGIPVEVKEDSGLSALTLALTRPHAGGKFDESKDGAYSSSGGLHGIGSKATNAFSETLTAEVHRHGLIFKQDFHNGGIPKTNVQIFEPATGEIKGELSAGTQMVLDKKGIATKLIVRGKSVAIKADPMLGTGTITRFRPARKWFSRDMEWPSPEKHVPWSFSKLDTRFSQIAYLYPGVIIEFSDLRGKKEDHKKKVYHSDKGLIDYLSILNSGEEPIHKPVCFEVVDEVTGDNGQPADIKIQIALQYAGDETQIYSFVNAIPTRQGGTHETGFKSGLTKAIKTFAQQKKLLKSDVDIKGDDVLLGLTAIIAVTMTSTPQFLSQTKESLTSPEVQGPVFSATYNYLTEFFAKNGNYKIGQLIVNQAKAAARGRDAAIQARKLVINRSSLDAASAVLGKLSDVQRRGSSTLAPLSQTGLFLVEGDSAGGSCKQGRDSRFHAILPLRGKVLNTEKKELNTILKNNEVQTIVAAIGAGIGADFDVEKMRYGRIVILVDADKDGAHIAVLLLTLFWNLMRPMINAGRLWIAVPPLYLVRKKKGNGSEYVFTESGLKDVVAQMGGSENVTIQRYKGLGEMNPEQIRETILQVPEELNGKKAKALNANGISPFGSAHLLLVQVDDIKSANNMIKLLMGNDVAPRREWLMSKSWASEAEKSEIENAA